MKKVINLISGPRNISTALMYSFAQHPDFKVLDEPFYGHYLRHGSAGIHHPMEDEIKDAMPMDEEEVVNHVNQLAESSWVFVKGMAHHYLDINPTYILDWNNIILIRKPEKLITSFAKVVQNPSLNDIGYERAAALYSFLKENGKEPLVIDSDELMKAPEKYLRKMCTTLNITFETSMLQWKEGGIPEDGIWAPFWYKNVHGTTGFQVQQQTSASVPSHLEGLLEEALPYYETLRKSILLND